MLARLKGEVEPTVDVISAEQTSQTYFTPPSPPLAAIFFRITPMMPVYGGAYAERVCDGVPKAQWSFGMGDGVLVRLLGVVMGSIQEPIMERNQMRVFADEIRGSREGGRWAVSE